MDTANRCLFVAGFPPISRQPHQKRDVEEIILTNSPFL
jgi:hypothetical protein